MNAEAGIAAPGVLHHRGGGTYSAANADRNGLWAQLATAGYHFRSGHLLPSERGPHEKNQVRVPVTAYPGILGVQAIASFGLQHGPIRDDPWLWPFLGYPMYAIPHYEGDRMSRNRVYGILADSSEVAVTHSTLGTDFWTFRRGLVFALLNGDRQEIEAFADLYEQRHGRRPVPFRLEDHPLILGHSGVTEARPEVRMIVPVEPQEGAL